MDSIENSNGLDSYKIHLKIVLPKEALRQTYNLLVFRRECLEVLSGAYCALLSHTSSLLPLRLLSPHS